MPIELVTLGQAKAHLRVTADDEDSDIQLKLNAATRMAINYLDRDVFDTQAELDAAGIELAGDLGQCGRGVAVLLWAAVYQEHFHGWSSLYGYVSPEELSHGRGGGARFLPLDWEDT